MSFPPVIETERLRLRGHRVDDFPAFAAMWADPNVTRHISGKPFTREEAWSRMLRYSGHWSMVGFGYWLIEEKSSGRFTGEAGFADYKRDLDESLGGLPEIGWVFTSESHGKGYATEAVNAMVQWGDVNLPMLKSFCIIVPENVASVRVAEKCGYVKWQETTYKDAPIHVFLRDAD